jgi:hypothetical protein
MLQYKNTCSCLYSAYIVHSGSAGELRAFICSAQRCFRIYQASKPAGSYLGSYLLHKTLCSCEDTAFQRANIFSLLFR